MSIGKSDAPRASPAHSEMTGVCPTEPEDDAGLAARAQQGCSASFERLVQRHTARLFRFMMRRTGGNRQDAEDLVQDTWLKAHRFLNKYDPARPFSTWLLTIGARLASSRRPPPPVLAADDGICSVAPEAGRGLESREHMGRLWRIAESVLSEAQREALWLFYVEEMKVSEVAEAMGSSVVRVKVLLHRARLKMTEALHSEGELKQ